MKSIELYCDHYNPNKSVMSVFPNALKMLFIVSSDVFYKGKAHLPGAAITYITVKTH